LATGSIGLKDLPSSGTWTLTIYPDSICKIGNVTDTLISELAAGNYSFTVTNELGCISEATDMVTVHMQPVAPQAPLIGSIIQPDCSEATGSVELTGLPSGEWILKGIPDLKDTAGYGSSPGVVIPSLTAGTYTFTVTDSTGCFSVSSDPVVIEEQPETPPTPVITLNGNVLHSDAVSGNQWYTLSGSIDGATLQDYAVTTDGDYYAVVTNGICSSEHSDTLHVTITAINQDEFNKAVRIYPNPVKHELTIEVENGKTITGFEITNSIGQIVRSGQLIQHLVVNTADFSTGVYLIKLVNEKNAYYGKIVKE
jgi:hypothetical protein